MSIQSSLGNIKSNIGNSISSGISAVKDAVSSLIGRVSTALSSLWDGGFVGINENNAGDISTALEAYIQEMEDILAKYNTETNIDAALKGATAEASKVFLESVRDLVSAYLSNMRQSKHDLDEVLENYAKGSSDIAKNIENNASDIRKQAQTIHMD